jgi:hypothetical protein
MHDVFSWLLMSKTPTRALGKVGEYRNAIKNILPQSNVIGGRYYLYFLSAGNIIITEI